MIKPTVGRVVLVRPGINFPGFIAPGEDQRLAAMVAYVHDDRLINVGGVDSQGLPFQLTSLMLLQPGDAPPIPGIPFAEWMPYQVGQAAKNDDLAPRVAALEGGYSRTQDALTDAVARTPVGDPSETRTVAQRDSAVTERGEDAQRSSLNPRAAWPFPGR